jgi:cell fate (sporulation/competence/biofilm development) regulator YlbF (YheA/YmcA/DUF963 family)
MSAVLELAERLGKAIQESPQTAALRQAQKAMNDQPELQKLLKEYQDQSDKIARLEQEKKPVEVEDKHKLDELQDKLLASEVFKRYTQAQVEYVDLLRQVNGVIRKKLSAVEGEESGS